jgi:hypothetical protein
VRKMTGTAYRAYCRSVVRVQCSPVFLALAAAAIGVAYLVAQARMHIRGLDQAVRGTGALMLLAIGLGVLALAVRGANRNRAVVTVPETDAQVLPQAHAVSVPVQPVQAVRHLHSAAPSAPVREDNDLIGAGRP